MNQRLLHTPDGVRDIYNGECARKLRLQENLHEVLKSYGFRDIETPTFEFFDVFGSDVGTIPSRELYKFFDREGNTLVLRPDITPSVARAASKYFAADDAWLRLCYMGKTFINHSSYQGRLKENTQLGAELIGTDTAEADAEMIAMAVDCLKKAGLEEFQISIGQMEVFKSIIADLPLDAETENELKDFISNRNLFGVESLLAGMEMDASVREALLALPSLYGAVDVLEKARTIACNARAQAAIDRLNDVYEILKYYGAARYVSFDLSMLSRYDYYTGIFFRGYTFGTGDAVVKGGRYDNLLGYFGKEAPATGFAIVIDELLLALARQKIGTDAPDAPKTVHYPAAYKKQAVLLAQKLRAQGTAVALQPLSAEEEAQADSAAELIGLCRNHQVEVGEEKK